MTDFNFQKFQEVVATLTGKTARAGALFAGLTQLFDLTDDLLQQQHMDGEPIACDRGCGTCCMINVAVLYPEALFIADNIDSTWGEDQKQNLRRKLADLSISIRWLDNEERLLLRKPCAFLDHHSACSIHPYRPLMCRSLSSIDAEQCHEATVAVAFNNPPTIIANLFQQQLYEAAYTGVATGLRTAGLPTQSGKLTSVLNAFLSAIPEERTPQLFIDSCRH